MIKTYIINWDHLGVQHPPSILDVAHGEVHMQSTIMKMGPEEGQWSIQKMESSTPALAAADGLLRWRKMWVNLNYH